MVFKITKFFRGIFPIENFHVIVFDVIFTLPHALCTSSSTLLYVTAQWDPVLYISQLLGSRGQRAVAILPKERRQDRAESASNLITWSYLHMHTNEPRRICTRIVVSVPQGGGFSLRTFVTPHSDSPSSKVFVSISISSVPEYCEIVFKNETLMIKNWLISRASFCVGIDPGINLLDNTFLQKHCKLRRCSMRIRR